jgi:hypothetical protein
MPKDGKIEDRYRGYNKEKKKDGAYTRGKDSIIFPSHRVYVF